MTDDGPLAGSDGCDPCGISDQAVPGLAGGGYDRFVAVEDAIGELGLAEELPDVFSRIELGRFGRQLELRGDLADPDGEVFLNASISAGSWPRWRGRAEMWRNPSRRTILPIVRSW